MNRQGGGDYEAHTRSRAIQFCFTSVHAQSGAANVDRNEIMKDMKDIGFVTKQDIAQRFHRTPRTIEVWMRTGVLPYFKVGRSVFFRLDDVERHFEQQYRCLKKPALTARRNKTPKMVSSKVAPEAGSMLATKTITPQQLSTGAATTTLVTAQSTTSES